jgi:sulfatase modifying factor 1
LDTTAGDPVPGVPDSVKVPEGTVYVPGGTTRVGITEETWQKVQRMSNPGARMVWGRAARPSFVVEVDPFFLEKHPVTVAQFRRFVEETGFDTQAESFGNAGVMARGRWQLVEGADWQHPRGPSAEKAPSGHPVTQVSWNDARSYCAWKDRRLPTEVEWEHAARGATNSRALCPDGECPAETNAPTGSTTRAEMHANTWQGRFPVQNTVADGFRYTSPVGTFGETALGLTDMSGNVWEWTASWYRPYSERGTPFQATKQSEKVQRGGSFQCNECGGYRVFSRSHATRETSLYHVGFRCAKNVLQRD